MKYLIAIFLFLNSVAQAEMSEFAKPTGAKQTVASCQSFLASGKCDKFQGQPGALKPDQCQAEVNGDNWSVLSRLANCGSGFKMSAEGMWEAAKVAASNVGSAVGGVYNYLTDGNTRAATHESLQEAWRTSADYLESVYPYLATEFAKSYADISKKGGDPQVNAMKTAQGLAPRLMGKMMSVVLEVIKSKYEEFHCFDNNKQVEITCKVAGDLLIPPTGIIAVLKYGTKGLAQVPKALQKIDEFLKIGSNGIRKAEDAIEAVDKVDEVKDKIKSSLEDLRNTATQTSAGHFVDFKPDGTGSVKIGMLERNQKQFMGKLNKGLREGAVSEVDTGGIVGAKALGVLTGLSKTAQKSGKSVEFKGAVNVGMIDDQFRYEVGRGARTPRRTNDPTAYWTEKEVQTYRQAYSDLQIERACRELYPNQPCDRILFTFNSLNPKAIQWRRP